MIELVFVCLVGAACPPELVVRRDLESMAACFHPSPCDEEKRTVRILDECSPRAEVGPEIVVRAGDGCEGVPEDAAKRAVWIRAAVLHAEAHRCMGAGAHRHFEAAWDRCCGRVKDERGVACS